MNKTLRDQVMSLPPQERAELAQELWDSVHPPGSTRPGDVAVLTQEQMAELDRRLDEYNQHHERAEPWEVVRKRLWARFDK